MGLGEGGGVVVAVDSQTLSCLQILCACVRATRESDASLTVYKMSGESKGMCEGSYLCLLCSQRS